MKKINSLIVISLLAIILGFAFYWYEYRPSKIRQYCKKEAQGIVKLVSRSEYQSEFNFYYSKCLKGKGLRE